MSAELEKKFNLIPATTDIIVDPPKEVKDNSDVKKDFEQARASINQILEIGSQAIKELGIIATQSQNPDNYLAFAALVKSVNDAAGTLLKIHKQNSEVVLLSKPQDQPGEFHNHNHLHISTAEMANLLKASKELPAGS